MSQLSLLAATSRGVASTARRTAKVTALATYLRQLPESEIDIAVHYLSGELPQGKIGVGYAALRASADIRPATTSTLALETVNTVLTNIATTKGGGSAAKRAALLNDLFARATTEERDFLVGLLSDELRQGALAAVMIDAIAMAANIPPAEIRRAAMYAPHLGEIARTALHGQRSDLLQFKLVTLSPVEPMLAETAEDIGAALQMLGGMAAFEWKVDGARIQVHKQGKDVRIYTRNANDVAIAVPEIIEMVHSMPAHELVLDGEAIALDRNGKPLPFQMTMRRFGRKLQVDALRHSLPLHAYFFDCLKLNDATLTDRPYRERSAALMQCVPADCLVPRLVTGDVREAETFYSKALQGGHEGVMAKSLDAIYEAGKRGASWLKIKRTHTLDLAILAAEWGSGRRAGKLSNLHLGARGPDGFVMLGKTFKGLTDTTLTWQTTELLRRETKRDHMTVHVRPELVVEIAFNDIQASPHYPGGYALRFARVKRYRTDKTVTDIDSIETVRKLYEAQSGVEALRGSN